jgi:uncharacterized membrane protein
MSDFLNLPSGILKRIALFLLAFFFTYAGITHFTNPEFFLAIVPPYLPAPLALVYISGVAEILGGLGVIPFVTRKWAGWGLIALLVAVYPANIHMALHPEDFPDAGATALYLRLVFQLVFFAWAWWATQPDAENMAAEAAA